MVKEDGAENPPKPREKQIRKQLVTFNTVGCRAELFTASPVWLFRRKFVKKQG